MPFMHSEFIIIHGIAMDLYKKNGIHSNLDFEIKHREIIKNSGVIIIDTQSWAEYRPRKRLNF